MKNPIKSFLLFLCLALIVTPTFGATGAPVTNTDRKLNDLTNRFNSLEATWGRFQIGGNFSLEAASSLTNDQRQLPLFGFKQQMGLSLDAGIDQNFAFALKLSNSGGWGLGFFSNSSTIAPLTTPLQVDEAFIKYEYPHTLGYVGRFRFSLGPLGLVSDFFNNPAEGLAFQRSFNSFHLVALYSRVNTEFLTNSDQIVSTEEYLAGRIGWSNQSTVIGLNFIPNGIATEQVFSLDWSTTSASGKMAAELGWYSFDSTDPQLSATLAPGLLLSYSQRFNKNNFFQLKAGYLTPGFRPSYSSLNHAPDDNREWFVPNSRGLELYLLTDLKYGFLFENRLIGLTPIKDYDTTGTTYRLRSNITKNISPISQFQFGFETKQSVKSTNNSIFAQWNLQF